MPSQIWYPEPGDPVELLEGATGAIDGGYTPILNEGGVFASWQVDVLQNGRLLAQDILVAYNPSRKLWEEVDD